MKKKILNLKYYSYLNIGHEIDHNSTEIKFESFTREEPTNAVYLLYTKLGWMILLNEDYCVTVTDSMTQYVGDNECQLIEFKADKTFVKMSNVFTLHVDESIKPSEEMEIHDPSLDLVYADLYETYMKIKQDREAGELDGFSPTVDISKQDGVTTVSITDKTGLHQAQILDGSTYQLEESDKHEIASLVEEDLHDELDSIESDINELDSTKMEYYMVTIHGGHFEHDGEQLGYDELKDKFDDPSVFLYLVYLNLIFIPSIDVPNSAIAFSTAWSRKENYIGSQEEFDQPYIERVMINNQNVIHFLQLAMEVPENRINVFIDYETLEEELQSSCYPNIKVIKGLEAKLQEQIDTKSSKLENNYSQIPITCGRWIDGKEIKRRVYLVTSGLAKGNQIKVADKPNNMDLLIKGWGIVEGTDATKKAMTNSDILVYVNDDGVYATNNFTGYPSKLYVIIEYTVNA